MKVLLLITMLFSAAAYGQNSLSGRVTDNKTKEPLPGAVLYLHDLKTGTITDANGYYKISRLPAGRFLLEVRYTSYASKAITAEIRGETTLDIVLDESVAELHEVVVTGVSSATEQHRNPIPVIIVGKRQLLEQTSRNIIDAISRQPGISQVSTGAAISKPVIRGLGYNQVVTLYNGVRQEGQQWGDEHGIEVDEFSIDRIEIIKGPGSLVYGSDALAGVINLLTPVPVPEGKITGEFSSGFQSNNKLFGYSLMNAGNIKGFNWQLRLSGKNAGNYQNVNDGMVYNSAFHETNANGYLGVNRKWGYSQLHFTSFNQTIGMTEGERAADGSFVKENPDGSITPVSSADLKGYNINTPYQQINHTRIFLTNQLILGRSRLAATAGYQLNQRREYGDAANPNQYGLYFYMPTLTWDVKYFLPEFRSWKISTGAAGMFQRNTNKGSEFLIPEYTLNDAGAFVFAQKESGKWTYSGGLRIDERNVSAVALALDVNGNPTANGTTKFQGFRKVYLNYAASAGITYALREHVIVKLNIARGFRAPTLAELSANGRHEGTLRYERGNTGLGAETSLQTDIGTEISGEHVNFEISIFSNRVSDYIYTSRLSSRAGGDSITDPSDPVPTYRYTQGDALLYGGEVRLDIHPHPLDWLHFENSFSLVNASQDNQPDSSRYLPGIPAPRLLSELRINVKDKGKRVRSLFFKVNLDHYFRQDRYLAANHTETATDAYTLVHLGMGTELHNAKGKKYCSVIVGCNNVFDLATQDHLSRLKYAAVNPATGRTGVFGMGRNVSIRIVVPLVFR